VSFFYGILIVSPVYVHLIAALGFGSKTGVIRFGQKITAALAVFGDQADTDTDADGKCPGPANQNDIAE